MFRVVQPRHLNLISAISWTSGLEMTFSGPRTMGSRSVRTVHNVVELYSKAAKDAAIHLSSVIILLELGILGSCKVKMSLYNEPRPHFRVRNPPVHQEDGGSYEAVRGRYMERGWCSERGRRRWSGVRVGEGMGWECSSGFPRRHVGTFAKGARTRDMLSIVQHSQYVA